MEPPWIKYPKIPLGSIGWRMGGGEVYWYAFREWYSSLLEDERLAFIASFPEPTGWQGFYERIVPR